MKQNKKCIISLISLQGQLQIPLNTRSNKKIRCSFKRKTDITGLVLTKYFRIKVNDPRCPSGVKVTKVLHKTLNLHLNLLRRVF